MRMGHDSVMGFLTCYTPTTPPVVFRYYDGRLVYGANPQIIFTKNAKYYVHATTLTNDEQEAGRSYLSIMKKFTEMVWRMRACLMMRMKGANDRRCTFFFLSLISLIADGPHHYHPACGH